MLCGKTNATACSLKGIEKKITFSPLLLALFVSKVCKPHKTLVADRMCS